MTFVVFSGLPGSGKSTLARRLATRVRLPRLDKDDYLDALFDERGVGDASWRAALSREADARFIHAAQQLPGACLVSWWRHPDVPGASGTPTDWLRTLPGPVVEVWCRCSLETAAARFLARRRHPGHLDATRPLPSFLTQFGAYAAAGPLGCGPVIQVDTEGPARLEALVRSLADLGLRRSWPPWRGRRAGER